MDGYIQQRDLLGFGSGNTGEVKEVKEMTAYSCMRWLHFPHGDVLATVKLLPEGGDLMLYSLIAH